MPETNARLCLRREHDAFLTQAGVLQVSQGFQKLRLGLARVLEEFNEGLLRDKGSLAGFQ